ncbi:MAG: tetratricopeptide repeat-containing sensor histidine kinase [Cyclobacteriaceae bacterium]
MEPRKNLYYLVICLICCSNLVGAQNKEIDSLTAQLRLAKEDTNKVLLLNSLASKLRRSSPDQVIIYAFESIVLADSLSFDRGLAGAYNSLGGGYWSRGDLDSALHYYNTSFQLNDSLGNFKGAAGTLSNMAIIYQNRSDYPMAIDFYSRALEIMRANELESYTAITTNNLGIVFEKLGNYPEALKSYNEAIEVAERLGMTNLLGPAWINVGNIYKYTDEPEKEIEAKEKALAIGRSADDKYVKALALNNLGIAYQNRNQFEKSLDYYQKALAINEEVGRKRSITSNLINIGALNRELREYGTSLTFLRRSLAMAENMGHQRSITNAMYQLGLTLKEYQNCGAAIARFEQGFNLASKNEELESVQDISKALYECYLESGDYAKAVYYQTAYMNAKDSLLSEKNIKELAKVQAQYEFQNQIASKQRIIEALETKEEVANLKVGILAISAVLVLVIGFLIARMLLMRKERKKKEIEALGQFKESMTGMIAHDLKNPLNAILSNSDPDSPIRETVNQMSEMINDMMLVHKFETAEVQLNKRQTNLTELIDESISRVASLLEKKSIKIVKEMSQDLQVSIDPTIISRVLVNLLTNAIKYSSADSQIILRVVWSTGQNLKVSVHDYGIGITPEQLDTIFKPYSQLDPRKSGEIASTGLGLTFCKLAIEAHGSEIHVDSTPGEGTVFSFELPSIRSADREITEVFESTFTMGVQNEDERKIQSIMEELKEFQLHNAYKIERRLNELGLDNQDFKNVLLDAAYSGDRDRYDSLLDGLKESETTVP